jgi:hypothetical protein
MDIGHLCGAAEAQWAIRKIAGESGNNMGFNKRRMAREREAAERAEQEQRRREQGRDLVQAQKLVAIWNSRTARKARPSFYPTLETALLAGTPWLSYQCPACQVVGEVDLRTLDRHPMMPISGLISALSCRWCCPNPPFAKLLALAPESGLAEALRRPTR